MEIQRGAGCTGVLISQPSREGNKLQRQKILIFMYPIYNHNWRNIITVYIYLYNKTSVKRNILTMKQNTWGARPGKKQATAKYSHHQTKYIGK